MTQVGWPTVGSQAVVGDLENPIQVEFKSSNQKSERIDPVTLAAALLASAAALLTLAAALLAWRES